MKFIYWFAYYNLDAPSVRYRAKYPLAFFRKHYGIQSYLVSPGYSVKRIWLFLLAYCSALFFRKRNSLIVIQRVHTNFIYATLLKLLVRIRKTGTVYDIDDAVYLDRDPGTILYFSRHCEKISAGSREIAQYLSQYNSNIVWTTSPIVDLGIVKQHRSKTFTVGWIGGFAWGHRDSLFENVFPALRRLSFPFKLVMIGVTRAKDQVAINEYFKHHQNITVELPQGIDWEDERQLQQYITKFDVGIATLEDTKMQRSKSGIKAKQYLNNGIPTLSVNLPENNDIVRDDYNGYLCSNSKDFERRLLQFYQMSEEDYRRLSENARESIRHFNHSKYWVDFMEAAELA